MSAQVITAKALWTGTSLVENPVLRVEEGRIVSLESRGAQGRSVAEAQDFAGATLAPSFFDVHFHGSAGHDVMEATPEALGAIGGFLATRGVARYLATTVTASVDATLRALEGLADRIEDTASVTAGGKACARPLGIHLEGPFLSSAKCGVQPKEHLQQPSIELFDRFFEAARGHVHLMTIAPELEGAPELIAHAARRGVRSSLGHTNAVSAEVKPAIAAGATSATHTYNAMRPLDHREPGILGEVLATDSLYAELICDGLHVAPEAIQIWFRAKGAQRAILVTDAMSAAGMPDGEYTLGGFPVQVAHGKAMARGVLAGSTLTLDRALANFVRFTGTPVATALRLLTTNPAAMTGVKGAGAIGVGDAANFVAVDAEGKLLASVVEGLRA